MKKIIFVLCILTVFKAFSQRNCETVFDFTNPTELTPSVTPSSSSGGDQNVNNYVFTSGAISISFGSTTDSPNPGARLVTFFDQLTNETTYYLKLSLFTSITFKGIDGVSINSISISDDSQRGGLYLPDGQPGELNYFTWTSSGASNVNSVSFNVSGSSPSHLYKISVSYTEPSDILSPISTDIVSGQTLSSFQEMNLTFADNMSVLNAGDIKISNTDNSLSKYMTASISGKTVKLSIDSPINTDGMYTITIPARSFENSNGYQNKELKYTFIISTPKNTLYYENVSPEQGSVKQLPNIITMHYPSYVKVAEGKEKLTIKLNGEDIAYGNISIDATHKNTLLTFSDLPQEITDEGVYSIYIPEGTITNNMGTLWNPAFTLTYTIGAGTDPGTDPEPPTPDAPDEETETMKMAKELLKISGVGYPKAESASRSALLNLVNNDETPADEILQAAINAMYNETDVEMPIAGKYYKIAGRNASGKLLYIAYADSTMSLSEDVKKATIFESVAGKEEYNQLFCTADGKYLYVGGITDNEDLDTLSLAKMQMPGIDAEILYGSLSITGNIKNPAGKVFTVPTTISFSDGKIVTEASMNELYFDDALSSAFVVTEAEKPVEGDAVELEYTITPDEIVGTGVLTITFAETETVTLADNSKPYYATKNGDRIGASGIYVDSNHVNTFIINVTHEYAAGDYLIILPEGTFTCIKDGLKCAVKSIAKEFKITEKEVDYDFNYNYSTVSYYGVPNDSWTPIMDTDLNNVIIMVPSAWYTGLVPDVNKKVELVREKNNNLITTGHFETTESPEENYLAIRLILDNPIKEGDLGEDKYTIKIQKATFGDANFGKYINGDRTISPSDCRANPEMGKTLYVSNKAVTGISELNTTSTNGRGAIYNLAGNRLQQMSRPGIYIVNGRKIVSGK